MGRWRVDNRRADLARATGPVRSWSSRPGTAPSVQRRPPVSPAKLATARGARSAFVVALILAYVLGTAVLQVGYQSGGALTVAGLATLLANASPVAAATALGEPVPSDHWAAFAHSGS